MFKLSKFFSDSRFYLAIALIITYVAMVIIVTGAYRGEKAFQERELIKRAEVVALSLELGDIYHLAGNETDLTDPTYLRLKRLFENLRESNPDTRFIYLAGRKENSIFFYLDSEPADSPDYSPPGQVYDESSPVFREVFHTGQSRFEGPLEDRWGDWITAFAAISDPESGEVAAVLGIDVDSRDYNRRIFFAVTAPIALIVFLFLLSIFSYVNYNKELETSLFKGRFLSMFYFELQPLILSLMNLVESMKANSALDYYAVKGGARINDQPEKNQDASEKLEMIKLTGQNIFQAIADIAGLADLSESEYWKIKSSAVNLSDLIKEITESLAISIKEKNIQISFKDLPSELSLNADRSKLKRAFSNIIMNAIKYSRSGGLIKIGYKNRDDGHLISISDDGIGIPKGEQAKVFSLYFRASNVKSNGVVGRGLGLYFTKQLVEIHGGKIWFESKESSGTTFYILMPKSSSRFG